MDLVLPKGRLQAAEDAMPEKAVLGAFFKPRGGAKRESVCRRSRRRRQQRARVHPELSSPPANPSPPPCPKPNNLAPANHTTTTAALDELAESDPLEACVGVPDLDPSAGDAASLVDQGAFDALRDLAAAFPHLPSAGTRARVVDAFSAGAASVATGAAALLEQQVRLAAAEGTGGAADSSLADQRQQLEIELGRHRAALKAYLWLAHDLTVAADDEAAATTTTANAPPVSAAWAAAWSGPCREATLRAALAVLSLDLAALYRGLAAAERPIGLALDMALRAAESPEAMRGGSGAASAAAAAALADDPTDAHAAAQLAAAAPSSRAAVVRLLALGAARYGQAEYVARQLVARARRHDHLPAVAAASAAHGEAALNSTSLAVCLVAEFCRPSPRDYDAEAQRAAPGVKRAAELLVALAEAAPRTVAQQMSTIQPFLACQAAATVRAAVVSAAGVALRRVYCPGAISAATAAGAARAHLRSKEHLLALLRARVLDKAAYVRQRALRTWAALVDARCVPLSWWNAVLAAAVGRLEDESRLVSRDALGLLCRMVHANPFGPALETSRFEATLAVYEAQAEELRRQHGVADEEGEEGQGGEGEEEGEGKEVKEEGDEGAAWERGDVRVEREEEEGEEHQPAPMAADEPAAAADLPADGELQRLRHLVASLREAVAFCRALTASMPAVRALLAQPSADSVQQAVVLLALCRRFRVPGAESALRAMWPLVFSREEGVRRTVLDAWHDLYVLVPTADVEAALERVNGGAEAAGGGARGGRGGSNAAASAATVAAQLQAANLMALTEGCTVGELDSLEAILAQLACPLDGSPARLQTRPLLLQVLAACAAAKRALCAAAAAAAGAPAAAAGDDAVPRGADQVAMATAAAEEGGDGTAAAPGPLEAARRTLARGVALAALLAGARPAEVAPHAGVIADVGLAHETGGRDPYVARHAALALARCAPALLELEQRGKAAGAEAEESGGDGSAVVRRACTSLARVLLSAPPTPAAAEDWPAAAEACVQAIFALHPRPHALVGGVLRQMWRDAGLEAAGRRAAEEWEAAVAAAQEQDEQQQAAVIEEAVAAAAGAADPHALTRAFFVLGQAALQQLLLAERAAKSARARRSAEDKAALSRAQKAMDASAAAGGAKAGAAGKGTKRQTKKQQQQAEEDEDIGAQVTGAAAAGSAADFDARVDAAAQLAEHQVLGGQGAEWGPASAATAPSTTKKGQPGATPPLLLAAYGAVLSRYCHTRAMLSAPPALQQSALLALSQLMAADPAYCARHLSLAFTLLLRRLVPPAARCNLVVALSDLAGRYPNLLEPWSSSLFASLADGDGAVVRCALRALTHLALGGVVKPRGHVSRVAVLLVDDDPEVRARAAAFFAGLASTASGGGKRPGAAAAAAAAAASSGSAGAAAATNPVYNLLPDILSALCRDESFPEDKFATVMSLLLGYVRQDKQADSLRERIVARFDPAQAPGGGSPREWRMLAFCLASLGYSDRSARRMMEMLRVYRHALAEDAVFRVFATVCERAKKSAAAGTFGGGGGAKAAAAGAEGVVGGSGAAVEARERVAEYEAELLAARAQAVEAREVEAAVARAGEPRRVAADASEDDGDDQSMAEAGDAPLPVKAGAVAGGFIELTAVAAGADEGGQE
jgi:condensin complex subunit 1